MPKRLGNNRRAAARNRRQEHHYGGQTSSGQNRLRNHFAALEVHRRFNVYATGDNDKPTTDRTAIAVVRRRAGTRGVFADRNRIVFVQPIGIRITPSRQTGQVPPKRIAMIAIVVTANITIIRSIRLIRLHSGHRPIIATAVADMTHCRKIAENQRSEHHRHQSQPGPVVRGAAKDGP